MADSLARRLRPSDAASLAETAQSQVGRPASDAATLAEIYSPPALGFPRFGGCHPGRDRGNRSRAQSLGGGCPSGDRPGTGG